MRKPFAKLFSGLAKTRETITRGISEALGRSPALDGAAAERVEEALIAADIGVDTSLTLVDLLRQNRVAVRQGGEPEVRRILANEIASILDAVAPEHTDGSVARPHVIMVVGVNGVGKTTTIGKLAARYRSEGRTVLVAAGDTFRAAASEQLSIWAERSGAQFVGGQHGGDPAAVAFDALDAALARAADVLIIDTAGRLHTRRNLMDELAKIRRVLARRLEGAPHETLLVVDANTGQNALSQARLFADAVDLTGVALAKVDGTARGGIVVAIARELGLPVRYLGTGEGIDDLEIFDARAFAAGLVGGPGEEA